MQHEGASPQIQGVYSESKTKRQYIHSLDSQNQAEGCIHPGHQVTQMRLMTDTGECGDTDELHTGGKGDTQTSQTVGIRQKYATQIKIKGK